MTWNVWSVLNASKLENLLQIMKDYNISIACISETWFDSQNGPFSKSIKDAGYKLHHANRDKKRGGGTAIIYKKNLMIKDGEASVTDFSSFEFSYITLTLQTKRKVVLLLVYRKQEVKFSIFNDEFTVLMDKIQCKGDILMVVGDFNVWVEVADDKDASDLRNMMHSYGLSQVIEEPTHRNGHTLDHVYINQHQMEIEHKVINEALGLVTDHSPIIIDIPSANIQDISRSIYYRKVKDVDMNNFKEDLQTAYNTMSASGEMNFLQMFSQFDDLSRKVMDKHAPVVCKKQRTGEAPWIDQEYRRNRSLRRKYERAWKKNRSEENRNNYVNQKNVCVELSLAKQTSYYSKLVGESKNCQRSLFKIANELLDKSNDKVLPSHTNEKQLANHFNEYFVEKVSKIRRSIPVESSNPTYFSRPFDGVQMNVFRPTTEEEVKEIMKESGVKTSMEDAIPAKLLLSSSDVIVPLFVELINKSLAEGSMDGVKESVIDPLIKKVGLDSDEYKNYRPVNNLIFFSKLIERVVTRRLEEHMTLNCLHEPSAFAYKKYHNTETMMQGIIDEALRGFDQNLATIVVFLDLSAAFDTIDIDKLLEIMRDEMGIGGVALEWFRSYLSGRTQRVKIGNEYSEYCDVPCGVPQGSVLGPKLFGINVRSQPLVFKHCMFSTSSFADDSNGRRSFALTFQYQVVKNDVVNCMDHIITWNNIHFMKINPD